MFLAAINNAWHLTSACWGLRSFRDAAGGWRAYDSVSTGLRRQLSHRQVNSSSFCTPCTQVFASHTTAHHGPHLCVAVLPLWADLGWQSVFAPPANPAHGQNDALQDLPGVPAELPSNLQLHPLPSSPGQPRRAYLQGKQQLSALVTVLISSTVLSLETIRTELKFRKLIITEWKRKLLSDRCT